MKPTLIFGAIAAGLSLIQSTLLMSSRIEGLQPDLVLLVVVYTAHSYGREVGQWMGFGVGLVEDATSLTPFGFHVVVRLIIGAASGLTFQMVRLDVLLLPMVLALLGIVTKMLSTALVSLAFGLDGTLARIFTSNTLLESGATVIVAPIAFAFLKMVTNATGGLPKKL